MAASLRRREQQVGPMKIALLSRQRKEGGKSRAQRVKRQAGASHNLTRFLSFELKVKQASAEQRSSAENVARLGEILRRISRQCHAT